VTAEAFAAVEKTFGGWAPRAVEAPFILGPPVPTRRVVIVDVRDAVQTAIRAGHLGTWRKSDDFTVLDMAVRILGGDATTNGFLQSARGIGAIIGALMIASMSGFSIKGKLITAGSFAMPIFLLVFSAVHWLPFSLLTLMGIGWGFLVLANATNALLPSQVTDEQRVREIRMKKHSV
jgi:hypothetical protein